MLLLPENEVEPPIWKNSTSLSRTNCCYHCENGTTLFDFFLDIINIDGHLNCQIKSETNDLIVELDINNNTKNIIDIINSHYERILHKN